MMIHHRFAQIAIAMAASLIFSVTAVSAQSTGRFSDIDASPYEDAILYVQSQGIVQGYSDGTYRPENKINRAEFTKILIASNFAAELSGYAGKSCFSDVPADAWFAKYVCLAKDKGIIGGYPDGTFGPARNINVAESLKITMEALFGSEILPGTGAWYQKYMDYAVSEGYMVGAWNDPGKQITRGEMAELIFRISAGPLASCLDIIRSETAACSQYNNWSIDVNLSYFDMNLGKEVLAIEEHSPWEGNLCSSDQANASFPREVRIKNYFADVSDTKTGDESVSCEVQCHAWTCSGTPAPPPSPGTVNFQITSASCQLTKFVGEYDNEYTVSLTGTASGPMGARLVLPTLPGYISENWSSFWGDRVSSVVDRKTGDPETTNWTSTLVVGSGTKTVDGYVRTADGSDKESDSEVVICK